jgi:hypothetical protein
MIMIRNNKGGIVVNELGEVILGGLKAIASIPLAIIKLLLLWWWVCIRIAVWLFMIAGVVGFFASLYLFFQNLLEGALVFVASVVVFLLFWVAEHYLEKWGNPFD